VPNLLQKGHALMTRLLGKSAAVAVTYEHWKRNADGSPQYQGKTEITAESGAAIVGRTVFSSNREGGARIEFGDRDYLILASVFDCFGPPKEGDRIIEEVDPPTAEDPNAFGTFVGQLIYEVMPPATGEPAVRWSDPQHKRHRIHTKLVK
jgi:hypothetical protein